MIQKDNMQSVPPAVASSRLVAAGCNGRGPFPQKDADIAVGLDLLSNALYAVQRLCPGIPVLSIYWIHAQHPVYPIQEKMFQPPDSMPFLKKCLAAFFTSQRLAVCAYRSMRLGFRLARMRWLLRRDLAALRRERFDVVAKTWVFEPRVSPECRDFYYGDVQKRLMERGCRMLLICGDTRHTESFELAQVHTSTGSRPRMAEHALLSPWMPLAMLLWQIWTSIQLRFISFREQEPLIRRLLVEASREVVSHQSMLNGLHYWMGRALAKIWRPRAVMTLYEGRSNERCLWQGVKSVDRQCVIVGYQHTFLFPSAVCLLRPSVEPSRQTAPDVVLCLGEESKEMMRPGHRFYPSKLVSFGTFRRNADLERRSTPRPECKTVLVLPQGILWEARLLFDFAMQLAERLPDYRFILRCHPQMPFAWVRPHLSGRPEDFPNVESVPTQEDMVPDIIRSSVALYMGSTAVLYTTLHGLKPVHLLSADCPDADSLARMGNWRASVSRVDEAEDVIRRYEREDARRTAEIWRTGVAYVNRCMAAVDDRSVDQFLSAVGLEDTAGACYR